MKAGHDKKGAAVRHHGMKGGGTVHVRDEKWKLKVSGVWVATVAAATRCVIRNVRMEVAGQVNAGDDASVSKGYAPENL